MSGASELSVYGFRDSEGADVSWTTTNLREAEEYARRNKYDMVEHVYEWTETVPVEEHQYAERDDDDGEPA